MDFKGFDGWIPIFRGGIQKDSQGREHDGDKLIDQAVAKFNAAVHEPPACIGHPEDNAPAYGWVEGLKKQGGLLLAKFKQIQPEFAGMVKNGLFKKRSAAFYPDGTLRHVAFLGASPPAVKGLPDMAFSEKADATFEFTDNYNEKKEDNMTFKEKLIAVFNEIVGKLPDDGPTAAAAAATPAGKTFSEADLEAEKKKAADAAAKAERERLTAEFAEKERTARQAARRETISTWCASMVKEGKLTPALVKFGVPEMLLAFAEKEDVIEFGEEKTKATLYDRFKAMIETELPKVITFSEVATRDKNTAGAGGDGAKLEQLTRTKMEANKNLTYSAAFAEVQRENPDLARQYAAEFKEV